MSESRKFPKHTIVRFYIPLRRAMPIPGGPYYLYEHIDASWLAEYLPHPQCDMGANIAEPGRSFVQARWMHREGNISPMDMSLSQDAVELAMHELTLGQQTPGSDHQGMSPQSFERRPVATVMVASTPMLTGSEISIEKALSDAFDRILEAARRWETGYRIESDDLLFPLSSRPGMAPVVPWAYLDLEDPTAAWTLGGLFWVNEGAAHLAPPSDYVGSEGVRRIGTRYHRALEGDPFISFSSLSALAFRLHSLEGDFSSAAIQSFSSGEVLLEGLFQSVSWEAMSAKEGTVISYDDIKLAYINRWGRPQGLSHRLFKIFPTLVTKWPGRDESVPLTNWRTTAGRIRNRIIHSGYAPSETESRSVIEATKAMEASIKEIVLHEANLNRFPKTIFMLIGIEGLKKRSLYKGRIRAQIEAGMDEDWIGEFAGFRRRLDQDIWEIS